MCCPQQDGKTYLTCCDNTEAPTSAPSSEPTPVPSAAPTAAPSQVPTLEPSRSPTAAPTGSPTDAPTKVSFLDPNNPFTVVAVLGILLLCACVCVLWHRHKEAHRKARVAEEEVQRLSKRVAAMSSDLELQRASIMDAELEKMFRAGHRPSISAAAAGDARRASLLAGAGVGAGGVEAGTALPAHPPLEHHLSGSARAVMMAAHLAHGSHRGDLLAAASGPPSGTAAGPGRRGSTIEKVDTIGELPVTGGPETPRRKRKGKSSRAKRSHQRHHKMHKHHKKKDGKKHGKHKHAKHHKHGKHKKKGGGDDAAAAAAPAGLQRQVSDLTMHQEIERIKLEASQEAERLENVLAQDRERQSVNMRKRLEDQRRRRNAPGGATLEGSGRALAAAAAAAASGDGSSTQRKLPPGASTRQLSGRGLGNIGGIGQHAALDAFVAGRTQQGSRRGSALRRLHAMGSSGRGGSGRHVGGGSGRHLGGGGSGRHLGGGSRRNLGGGPI